MAHDLRQDRRPSRSARDPRIRTSAAAPSALADAPAAVMVPSARKAGFSVGIFSGDTLSGCSSLATTRSPPFAGTEIGAISATNAPVSIAFRARVSVSIA